MKRNTNSSNKTRRLVLIGALGGISIFLGISGLGLIRLPIFSLTIMHIPVIIGALLEGPIVGIAVGLIFALLLWFMEKKHKIVNENAADAGGDDDYWNEY